MKGHLLATFGTLALALACQRESRAPEPQRSSEPQAMAAPPRTRGSSPVLVPEPAPVPAPAPVPVGTTVGEMAVLVQAANRKMMHDDGKGCLEELDKLRQLDEKLESTLVAIRAQCEMLSGRCQAGKQALTDYYVREMNMSPELARSSVEAIASMRCRGGDATDRDRLLRALRELMDGAYMTTRDDCAANLRLVKELLPKVPPTGPDDTQVNSAPKALFHTGAACFARSGDCRSAFEVYQQEFPGAGLESLSEKERRTLIEKSFRSGIQRCKDARL